MPMMAIDQVPNTASVLLVDDVRSNLIALSAVLSPLGVRIVQVQSGAEAIERVREESFAVMLLDVQLPEMDGFEVAARVRALEHGRELPIIFLTAIHRDELYARKGYAIGAADYVTKPFDVEVLRARVRAFVDLYRQREEVRRVQVALRTRERDEAVRRVVAFERIATAALETNDLGALLRELLGIFLDGADAADTASILLRDGQELRTHAALSRYDDNDATLTPSSGLAFAARVAHAKKAVEQTEPSASEAALGRKLRVSYGVPLLHGSEVLGVAIMGSSITTGLSEREKRLFAAVTERAAWSITKHKERSRLHSVLNSAPALIAMFRGPELVCEFVNPGFQRFMARDDLAGRAARDTLGKALLDVLGKAYLSGENVACDELAVEVRGDARLETRFVSVTAQPHNGPTGPVDSVLLFAVDVTPQVRARKEVEAHQAERARLLERERAARADAEIASRAKDEFLATLSHELRTPLNAILGWTARARTKAPHELDRALAIVERNAQAQARLIDDMLDLSRIISGKLRLDISTVRLDEPLYGAVESVRPAAEAKEVELHVDIDSEAELVADPDRLQQMVWNLLSNAIKFTPKAGRVTLTARADATKLVITVTDTGRGIEPDFLPYVFEPFRQADASTTRRHGGLGLGLAIVRQLAHAHGGTVNATSAGVGQGSTFVLELPLRPARGLRAVRASHAERAEEAQRDASIDSVRLDGVRALVVDDEPDARALLADVLEERGAEVATAASAELALEQLARRRPHVLVSDIGMPDVDGYALIERVRALPRDEGGATPAIALTAYTRREDVLRSRSAGFQQHLAKPVDLEQLVRAVAELSDPQPTGEAT